MQTINLINGYNSDYLHLNNRAIHYGDGIFETILLHNQQLDYWQQHYKRLKHSAILLQLHCPSEETLLNDIRQLHQEINTHKSRFVIKIILSRQTQMRGYAVASQTKTDRIVSLSELPDNYSSLASLQLLSTNLIFCNQPASINKALAGIKHLNRLENVLASTELTIKNLKKFNLQNKPIEGLLNNNKKYIIEGITTNVFFIKDEQIYTPRLNISGVAGVIRNIVIDLAKKNKLKLTVKNITKNEIEDIEASFVSNSLIGIKSVDQLENKKLKTHKITKIIFSELLKQTTKCHFTLN